MDILSTDKCIGDGYHFKEANIIYSRWMLLLGFVDANLKYVLGVKECRGEQFYALE